LGDRARRTSFLASGASVIALTLAAGAPATAQTAAVAPQGIADATQPAAPAGQASDNAAAGTQPRSADGSPDEGVIIVTGYRQALQSAIQTKRNSDLVVESLNAEDIGKLPDNSIAESLARLPGLTAQRLAGRDQVVSIRGFAPDFSTTLLNGREQTTTSDNRNVEYDQYPSEIISQVNVYKSPSASLIGQGLSGTVDLRTIRPLDVGKRILSIGARGEYVDQQVNRSVDDKGYRVQGTYVDQFLNDTLGVALSISHNEQPYQIKEFNTGYYAGATGPNGQAVSIIGENRSFATSSTLNRTGVQATGQWRPSQNFTASLDFFYSHFEDNQVKRGVQMPVGYGGTTLLPNTFTVNNGFVTDGTITTVKSVVRNDEFDRTADLYSGGLNLAWKNDNGLRLTGDLSYSRTDRSELTLETYSGTGRGFNAAGVSNGVTDTVRIRSTDTGSTFTPTLNYGDYNVIRLTSPQGWGGNQIVPGGPSIVNGQDGYYNNRKISDELYQFRAELEQDLHITGLKSVKVGVNYTRRRKSLTPQEFFLGLKANADGTNQGVTIPQNVRVATTRLDFLGIGPVVSYDPVALLNSGIYNLVPNVYQDVVTKGFGISEDLVTPYLQVNLDREFDGGVRLTGNFGAQAVITDQSSTGFISRYVSQNPDGSPNIATSPVKDGARYYDMLPSVNLVLRFPQDFVVRFAYAKEIIRPRLDDLRVAKNFSIDQASFVISGGGGNSQLRPWRADALDLTFEKYFAKGGNLAAQLFYKDVNTYVIQGALPFDFTGLPLGASSRPPISNIGILTVPVNGRGGSLYGIEIAGTIPLDLLTPALSGFGVTGSGSYTKSDINVTPDISPTRKIPGYSEWVANGTLYYEHKGFSIRGSARYRSSFVGELAGFGQVRTRRLAIAETIVDSQIGYEFQKDSRLSGLFLFFQAQNLTDQPFQTYSPPDTRQLLDYQRYGRRFLAGFNYKFQ
jgi:iron complex outermembrane receptor protein